MTISWTLLPTLFLGTVAFAQDPSSGTSGNLSYFAGEVTVEGVKASKSQPVLEAQVIRTGANSSAIVSFADGSQIKLNPETELKLDRLKSGTELSLHKGAIFSRARLQKGSRKFLVRTKTAVMGVRGTEFFTSFGKADSKGDDLWMCVNEGSVEVESTEDHKKVLVKQGEGIFVPAGKGVTPPKAYAWTKNLNWNMQPEKGEIIDRTRIDYSDLLKQNYD